MVQERTTEWRWFASSLSGPPWEQRTKTLQQNIVHLLLSKKLMTSTARESCQKRCSPIAMGTSFHVSTDFCVGFPSTSTKIVASSRDKAILWSFSRAMVGSIDLPVENSSFSTPVSTWQQHTIRHGQLLSLAGACSYKCCNKTHKSKMD